MMIMSEFVYMCTCTFFSYMLVSSSIICNSCQELSFYETKQKCSKEVKAYQAKLQFYRTRQLEGSKSLEFDLKLKRNFLLFQNIIVQHFFFEKFLIYGS